MQSFEYWRDEAAQALGLDSLPVELTTTQIALLYTQNAERCRNAIEKAIQTGALKARMPTLEPAMTAAAYQRIKGESDAQYWQRISLRLRGLDSEPPRFIHVTDFAAWAGKPPIPEGEAGERVRAWLSLAQAAEMAASAETPPRTSGSGAGGGVYLPRFAAIKAVLGLPEGAHFDAPYDDSLIGKRIAHDSPSGTGIAYGSQIYGLLRARMRDNHVLPVRTDEREDARVPGTLIPYFNVQDLVLWVHRELPDIPTATKTLKRLERERKELEESRPETSEACLAKHERLADLEKGMRCLKQYGCIVEFPSEAIEPLAAAPAPVAAGEAVKRVAEPAGRRRYVTKLEQQVEYLVSVVKELGYDPMCIPRDTKKKVIMPKCLERPDLFTNKSFSKAWDAASKQRRIRSALAEKTTPSRKGRGSPP